MKDIVQAFNGTLKWSLLVAIILVVMSCGWRLRGSVELPSQMKKINLIQLAEAREFYKRLKRTLQYGGAEVVETKVGADISLTITQVESESKSAAVDSVGRTVAKEISMTLIFNLQDNQGISLAEQDEVRTSRIFRYNPDNVLGMELEESRVVSGLTDEMVAALISRIKNIITRQDLQGQPSAD